MARGRGGVEPPPPALEAGMLPLHYRLRVALRDGSCHGGEEGVEPPPPACGAGVLPLHHHPHDSYDTLSNPPGSAPTRRETSPCTSPACPPPFAASSRSPCPTARDACRRRAALPAGPR